MDKESLLQCFDIDSTIRSVALVGGGGKTSLMYALARELVAHHETVVTTTTTKILPPKSDDSPCLNLLEDDPELFSLAAHLAEWGHVTVAQSRDRSSGKLQGVSAAIIRRCLDVAGRVLIEADGAAGRPIKAPESWEPVIPDFVDLVIPVVGLECVGKPATEEWVFRLERFLSVTGLGPGEIIGPNVVSRLLSHPEGALKGVPLTARVVPFLNKLDLMESDAAKEETVEAIITATSARIRRLVVGMLKGEVQVYSALIARR
ncbi:MAG: selenium cofactor biosynthesis protein YqeC [Desulfomonilaceae bacterium]